MITTNDIRLLRSRANDASRRGEHVAISPNNLHALLDAWTKPRQISDEAENLFDWLSEMRASDPSKWYPLAWDTLTTLTHQNLEQDERIQELEARFFQCTACGELDPELSAMCKRDGCPKAHEGYTECRWFKK